MEVEDKDALILLFSDGWEVRINNRTYRWNHNDEDLGTHAILVLLEDLGYHAKIEECC